MIVVADTSRLIHFAVAGLLPQLGRLLGRVCIPPQVRDELVHAAPLAPGVLALREALSAWLVVVALDASGTRALSGLVDQVDQGEAAAIALALQLGADLVVIDDRDGRRAAHRGEPRVIGTVGLLVEARRKGQISALTPVLAEMRAHGLWVSDELVNRALVLVGEQ